MSTLTCVLSPIWPAQQLLLKPSFPACSHPVASSNSPSHFPYSLSPSWAFLLLLVDQTQALLFTLAVPFPPRLRSPIIFLLHLSSFLHGSQHFLSPCFYMQLTCSALSSSRPGRPEYWWSWAVQICLPEDCSLSHIYTAHYIQVINPQLLPKLE